MRCERVGASDEPMVERGKARRRRASRAAGTSSRSPGATSWKSSLAAGDVLQPMPPEGRNEAPGRGSSPAMSRVALRDDDLLAVCRRADARRDDDVHADVALVAELGLARVDADPQPERLVVRPRLGGERALDLGGRRDRVSAHARRRGTRRPRPSRPRCPP